MKIPPIPYKYKSKVLSNKDKESNEAVFTYFVRQFYFTQRWEEGFTFLQFSQLVFREANSDLMRRVLNSYKNYFSKGTRNKLLLDLVYSDFPHIWGEEKKQESEFSITEIIKSIDDEIRDTYRANKNLFIPVYEIEKITERNDLKIYRAIVVTKSDEFVNLDEGANVTLTSNENVKYWVTILDYNKKNEVVAFQTTQNLSFKNGKIKVSNVALLYKLKEALEELKLEGTPIKNLLYNSVPNTIKCVEKSYLKGLSNTQIKCLKKVFSNDVTFIWGPPGTGKSFTLSKLLVSFYLNNEKTLVTSTANIAIDGLLEKTANVLDEFYKKERRDLVADRRILRIGYSQSNDIRINELFKISNETIDDLNYKLQLVNEEIDACDENKVYKIAQLKSRRDEIKQELDNENKKLITDALLIYTTSAKFISDDGLKSFEYDNLVIDEGSMMSLPYLLILASKVKKRIIVTGDFMQLGPISISQSSRANRWLKSDLFNLLGDSIDTIISHKALIMLQEQRRMARPIAELISKHFYNNKLITIDNLGHRSAFNAPPSKGHLYFIDTPKDKLNVADIDKNTKSRYNKFSRNIVYKTISQIINSNGHFIKTIGVISPYKQQIIDYKNETEGQFFNNIEVIFGTIHTFQGSECDVIIWDMVDTLDNPIGSLYKDKTGERLVNVAISRAKSKLIIVGQSRLFHECQGRDMIFSSLKRIVFDCKEASLNN